MSAASDRAVRKALLQAQAELERIELAQRVGEMRNALSPGNLVQRIVPMGGSVGEGLLHRLGGQLLNNPALLSGAALFLRKGNALRLVKIVTAFLAMRKAWKAVRGARR